MSEQPTEAERVAALHQECAADYTAAPAREAAARDQLAHARTAGNAAASTR